MSYWNVELKNLCRHLVDAMLPRFSPKDAGLYVCLDLRMNHYTNSGQGDVEECRLMHLLFQRPTNFVKVFMTSSEFMFADLRGLAWVQTANHDLCWHIDGLRPLSRVWHEMKDALIAENPKAIKPSISCYISKIQRAKVTIEISKESKSARRPAKLTSIEMHP